jgi:hypothetical protein
VFSFGAGKRRATESADDDRRHLRARVVSQGDDRVVIEVVVHGDDLAWTPADRADVLWSDGIALFE